MTDLDKIILNFLNENKLYPTNIVNNLTKKLGDSSNETLNKLAIFGLFRQAPPFNTIKDINQLQSLEQLNDLFDKWKESALQQLIGSRGELKGNKTASMTYLDAYVDNIASLGNNAKPFSYKDTEQTLIDVCNNNSWIKSNDVTTQTYGIDKPHDQDILVDTEDVLVVKAPSKAKCIMYGKGYSWCISQTQLNYYTTYRINHGGTIYFVLNKKLPVNDNKRVCVILRYEDDMYGIADKTNTGDMSGGPGVAKKGFGYVESVLPWVKGYSDKFTYNEVSESERQYQKVIEKPYEDDDLGNYIINKSKELKFNSEEIDPVDMLRDYLSNTNNRLMFTDEQFINLSEPMKIQVIEMGIGLSEKKIMSLGSQLKVRYAVLRLSNNYDINLGLYTDEERGRVLNNLKDKLDDVIISSLLRYTPFEERYDLVKQIFPLVKDKLTTYIISKLLNQTPEARRYDLVKQIFPLVKDKLDGSIIEKLLSYTPKEQRYELVKQIFPLVKDKLDGDIVGRLLYYTPQEQRYNLVKQIFPLVKDKLTTYIISKLLNQTPEARRYDLVKQIFPLVKDKLDGSIIEKLLSYTPKEQRYELVKQIFPLVKDKLDGDIVGRLLYYTPQEQRYNLVQLIFPLVKDKLDADIVGRLLGYTPQENKQEVQTLIDKYKPKDIVNELRLIVRKILKENY